MKRREFIAGVAAAGAAGALSGRAASQESTVTAGQLARRRYGSTDTEISIIGLGGIVVSRVEQSEANDMVAWAVERGVNYFDVAPTYGNAQERLGPALKPYRDQSFLACKTTQRDAAGAQAELEESLRLLQTDHFDLYQFHGVKSDEEVDQILAPGGAMETFLAARERGDVRHIGFSAHSVTAAIKLMDSFDFDSILFPLNCVCMENGNFGPQVLEKTQEKGAAPLAIKALAWTPMPGGVEKKYPKCWYQPIDDRELARMALSYTLSLPVVAAVPPGDPGLFQMAVELALEYTPITEDARGALGQAMQGVEPIFKHG
jgi:aryl-alcohol dehydrogenase-like predicted oxidoreductase